MKARKPASSWNWWRIHWIYAISFLAFFIAHVIFDTSEFLMTFAIAAYWYIAGRDDQQTGTNRERLAAKLEESA